ncbi:PIN domain-containing protein [Halomonas sp. DP8Y7-1]|uniref:PIN domain-containing protein n=1 Tax=Halomonas sp. DP8Y7-1 TaxID=2859078 RepID=UPI001C9877F3|nr:PIN domain-containing protein [Halomonas sp. DP8Y7-1]MBY6029243.1 PIN domain-containing protein [Halomonas sp. DP8Y7-1]
MIFLDINVLFELMRPVPNARVVEWLDRQDAISVTISAITVAEILYGIERLPDGRRKRDDGARSAVYRSAGSLCFRVVVFTIIKVTALFWMERITVILCVACKLSI